MKPIIISTLCIAILLSAWGFFYIFSGAVLTDLSTQLNNIIYETIEKEDWPEAESQIKAISKSWEKNKTIFYMLSNHSVVRETDISLARLKEFVKNEEVSDAHAEIGAITELMLSIRQGEAFTVDNIL